MNETVAAAADRAIPDALPALDYFLKEFNTPDWHWLIRGVFAAGFVLVCLVYFHYRGRVKPEE